MKKHRAVRLHISWHIAWLSAGLVIGTAAAAKLRVPLAPVFMVSTGIALALTAGLLRYRQLVLCAMSAGILVGMWRGSIEQQAVAQYQQVIGHVVSVRGMVSEDTSLGTSGDQRIILQGIHLFGKPLHGKLWVSIQRPRDIKRGDLITVTGTLSEGFGNVPASIKRGSIVAIDHPRPGDVARQVRDWFTAGISRAIPNPQAALGIGYLVGQHAAMPQALSDHIKAAGLTHAVVASGYNLTILVGFTRRIFLRYSKFLATLSGASMIIAFMLVTGLSPSMTRAGLVTGFSLLTWYYGRKIHPLVVLPFAAAITTLITPAYAWGDIGWCLSFTSFAGVLILSPLLHAYFWGTHEPGTFRQTLIETCAAQVITTPIILMVFGQFATYALIANMLVLPFIPFAMLLTFFAGIAGLAIPHLAQYVGLPARLVLEYMTSVIDRTAQLPNALLTLQIGTRALIISYLALALCCIYMRHRTRYSFRDATITTTERML